MTTEPHWKDEFEVLKNYIESSPEISIGIYEIFIPEELLECISPQTLPGDKGGSYYCWKKNK